MALTLLLHPLSSFCQKTKIALYENDIPFESKVIHLEDAASRGELTAVWPFTKFPVLKDERKNGETRIVPETSVIIEYLQHYYPGKSKLIPDDFEIAWRAKLADRMFDLYVNVPVGKIVSDTFRPPEKKDPQGVEDARALIETTYRVIEKDLATRTWAAGDVFTIADCAAAPALFFANKLIPLKNSCKNGAAYLSRLAERPSVARAFAEAEPYLKLFPG
jgi:glutathione S-transferase